MQRVWMWILSYCQSLTWKSKNYEELTVNQKKVFSMKFGCFGTQIRKIVAFPIPIWPWKAHISFCVGGICKEMKGFVIFDDNLSVKMCFFSSFYVWKLYFFTFLRSIPYDFWKKCSYNLEIVSLKLGVQGELKSVASEQNSSKLTLVEEISSW